MRARSRSEKGQALPLLIVALGLFLLGGMGLAIDGAQLYAQGQLAQSAADAAATAAALSIFQGVNVSGSATFFSTASAFTCTTSDAKLPCQYARFNGFGGTSKDTVTVDFPVCSGCGYDTTLSSSDTPNQIRVTITRNVSNTFIRMIGGSLVTPIKAVGVAAIVSVESPTPIIITDPWNENTLSMNGTTNITICGGPSRSIQINSKDPAAYTGSGTIDLRKAGTKDSGACDNGKGADFGVFGGESSNPGAVKLGVGNYISPASPIDDPLRDVGAPGTATGTPSTVGAIPVQTNTNGVTIHSPTDGCTFSNCTEYSPGIYAGGLQATGNNVIFKPGLYYMQGGGFILKNAVGGGGAANAYNAMCVGCTPDPNTGTGMVIYDTGSTSKPTTTGGFDINTGVQVLLRGATLTTTNTSGDTVPAAPYYGILFWEDRAADAHSGSGPTKNGNAHSLGQGNGCFTLIGTIYITNTRAAMLADSTHRHHQVVQYNGTPCSTTVQQGDIIVGQLQLVGTTNLTMNLVPYGFTTIRQVALVGGGPHP